MGIHPLIESQGEEGRLPALCRCDILTRFFWFWTPDSGIHHVHTHLQSATVLALAAPFPEAERPRSAAVLRTVCGDHVRERTGEIPLEGNEHCEKAAQVRAVGTSSSLPLPQFQTGGKMTHH